MTTLVAYLVIAAGAGTVLASVYFWRLHDDDHKALPNRKGHGLALVLAILCTFAAAAAVWFAVLGWLTIDPERVAWLNEHGPHLRPISFFAFAILDVLWIVLALYLRVQRRQSRHSQRRLDDAG